MVDEWLKWPWTVVTDQHDDDGIYFTASVKELPGFIVAVRYRAEREDEFWNGLTLFLESYWDEGSVPPCPIGGSTIFTWNIDF